MAVPAATPVNVPVLLTDETDGLLETHGFVAFAVIEPERFEVDPTQRAVVPETVGLAFTVTTVEAGHP